MMVRLAFVALGLTACAGSGHSAESSTTGPWPWMQLERYNVAPSSTGNTREDVLWIEEDGSFWGYYQAQTGVRGTIDGETLGELQAVFAEDKLPGYRADALAVDGGDVPFDRLPVYRIIVRTDEQQEDTYMGILYERFVRDDSVSMSTLRALDMAEMVLDTYAAEEYAVEVESTGDSTGPGDPTAQP